MAAMRLNIPTIFVTGGPMEAGKTKLAGVEVKLDLIDPMIKAGDTSVSDEDVHEMERLRLPDLWVVFGHVHRQLDELPAEALGLALPGNGTVVATHSDRERLFLQAGRQIVDLATRYYEKEDDSVLPARSAPRRRSRTR